MFEKIIAIILYFFRKIINWFKNIFNKKNKKEVKKEIKKEELKKEELKSNSPIGAIDEGVSVLSSSKDIKLDDVISELNNFIKNIDSYASSEIDKKVEEFNTKLSELKENEQRKKVKTHRQRVNNEKTIININKQKEILNSIKEKKDNIKLEDNKIKPVNHIESVLKEKVLPKTSNLKRAVAPALVLSKTATDFVKSLVGPSKEKIEIKKPVINKTNVVDTALINKDETKEETKEKKEVKEELINKAATNENIEIIDSEEVKNTPNILTCVAGTKIVNDIANDKMNQYKAYVKEANNTLKTAKNGLKEIEEGMSFDTVKLDDYKYRIEALKEKVTAIKKKYYEFKNSDYIYQIENDFNLNELDKFEVIKNDKNIDIYLAKCNSLLQKIDAKKYPNPQELKEKKEQKEEKKIEKKVVLDEQPKVKVPKILLEIEQANEVIKKDINEQRKEVSRISEKINNLPIFEQKKKRLGLFDNILTNTFKLGLTFLPLKLFKNRVLGMLTTGFLFNNRIRSMRKVLNPTINIDYAEINRRMKSQMDILNSYDTICNDSLYQVGCLKDEFLRNYSYDMENEDIKKIYLKIVDLEDQVLQQKESLANTKVKLKNNVKIKILERK